MVKGVFAGISIEKTHGSFRAAKAAGNESLCGSLVAHVIRCHDNRTVCADLDVCENNYTQNQDGDMLVTTNFICDLTGMDRRTVKKRLADIAPDSEYRYSSVEALRQIYIPSALDPQQERAQLDRARREIADIQKAKMQGELIPADIVQAHWEKLVGNARAKLLNIPGRLAVSLGGQSPSAAQVAEAARELIYEALRELAQPGHPDAVENDTEVESDEIKASVIRFPRSKTNDDDDEV